MRLFYLFFLCVCSTTVFSQDFYGMVKVNDKLWVDNTEITNNEFREFLKVQPESEQTMLYPDTTVWEDEAMASYYFQHPAFDNYPVVGISYQQAKAFCEWRTSMYRKQYPNQQVIFRLPSEDEWNAMAAKVEQKGKKGVFRNQRDKIELVAAGSYTDEYYAGGWVKPYGHYKKRKKEPAFYFNFAQKESGLVGMDGFLYTNAVDSYPKDGRKLYGMSGNVAEMLAEKGLSSGGSWAHGADKCLIGNTLPYAEPTAWLGFRCVVEVVK